jgi:hypothetical protein
MGKTNTNVWLEGSLEDLHGQLAGHVQATWQPLGPEE